MVELLEYGLLAPQFIYGWIMKSKWLGFQTLMYYQPNGGFRFWRNETCDCDPMGPSLTRFANPIAVKYHCVFLQWVDHA